MKGARAKSNSPSRWLGFAAAGVGIAAAVVAIGWRGAPHAARPVEETSRKVEHSPPKHVAREARRASPDDSKVRISAATVQAAAEQPIRVPELENPVLAATQAHRFSNDAEELAFWTERLRGERLTLENREQSLRQAERVLGSRTELGSDGVRDLERRRAVLDAKLAQQARVVTAIEERISELKQTQR